MTDEFTQIQEFLARMGGEAPQASHIRKAGIIPYIQGKPLKYYVMTPVASKPELGLPDFQICKGTRKYKLGEEWHDMKGIVPEDADLEPLAHTAIREGIEELGLKIANISRMMTMGEYHFTSATNRKEVFLWLFVAEIKNPGDFLPPSQVAASTQACAWLTLEEFTKKGRPDHAHILSLIEGRLG